MRGAARFTLAAGAVLIGAAWVVARLGLLAGHRDLLELLPEALGLLILIPAWRYRRHRLAAAAAVIGLAGLLIRNGLLVGPTHTSTVVYSVATALVVSLLAVTRDRPIRSPSGLAWLAGVAALGWVTVWGVHLVPDSVAGHLGWPPLVPVAAGVSIVTTAVAFAFRRSSFEGALPWVAVAAAAAFAGWTAPTASTLFFVGAQLTLLVAVFEDSYRLAYHDELTGLPGRRAFNEALRDLGDDFSIAMVDIDHFKRFNDRYGHDAGDQVLRMVADELAKCGGGGRTHRYGGEEFGIVFAGRTVADIRNDLEALRRSVADRKFALRGPDRPRKRPEKPRKRSPKRVSVHISIGVAGTNSRRSTPSAVLKAADRALYRAKGAGRNRVVAAGDRLQKKRG